MTGPSGKRGKSEFGRGVLGEFDQPQSAIERTNQTHAQMRDEFLDRMQDKSHRREKPGIVKGIQFLKDLGWLARLFGLGRKKR